MSRFSELIRDPAFTLAFCLRTPAVAKPSSLLVLLHGVGGNETNLEALAEAIADDTLVVLPRGRLEFAPEQYAWFRVAFTVDGPKIEAEEAEASRLALIRFVEQLQAVHGIAPERSVIAGFSQGGILSASVALSAPERVRGFAVLSGRILPELEPHIATRERLTHLHALIAHGRDDTKLPVSWAQRADVWLGELGVARELRVYPGDHGISMPMAQHFLVWQQSLLASAAHPARLTLAGEQALLTLADGSVTPLAIAPGIEALVRGYFTPRTTLAAAMENAIAGIEDVLAHVPASVHEAVIASNDPGVQAIARAAGIGTLPSDLGRDAVEHVFARLSAVAMGRPAVSEGLPDDPEFFAALLIVRELMHHLDIPSLQVGIR